MTTDEALKAYSRIVDAKDAEIARLREALVGVSKNVPRGSEAFAIISAALSGSPAPDPAEAMRAKTLDECLEIARRNGPGWRIIDAIAALKGQGEGK